MAILVPFVMSATGASAAIAGAIGGGLTAAAVSTFTAVAFTVTGVSEKINKAASKVFGEDLVNFANIAGAGFAMWNGGFDLGSGAAETAGGQALAASTPELTETAWNAAGADNLKAINEAVGITDGISSASQSFNLSDLSSTMPEPGDDGLNMLGKSSNTPTEVKGINAMKPDQPVMTDSKPMTPSTEPPKVQAPSVTAEPPKATTPSATANVAAKTDATATVKPAATAPVVQPEEQSFFRKLFADKDGNIDKRLVGATLQTAGSAFAGANANRLKQQQYEEEIRRRDSMAVGRFY